MLCKDKAWNFSNNILLSNHQTFVNVQWTSLRLSLLEEIELLNLKEKILNPNDNQFLNSLMKTGYKLTIYPVGKLYRITSDKKTVKIERIKDTVKHKSLTL